MSGPLSHHPIRDKLIAMHASKSTVPLAHLSPGYHPRRAAERWPWEIGRGRVWLGGLIVAVLLYFGLPAFLNWKHVISSSGGHYFLHRTVIPVEPFSQGDPRWADQLLGDTIDTLGQQGCAVTSAAMVMHAYGVDTDPQRLNAYLTTHGGFVGDGLLIWERAADPAGGQVEKAYEDLPSYALLDANILKGNPVIVRLHLRNGTMHFVVIVGKQGWDYLIRDPARPADWGVYPLRQITSRIEALRFYKIVPPPPGILPGTPYEIVQPNRRTQPSPAPAPGSPSITPLTVPATPATPSAAQNSSGPTVSLGLSVIHAPPTPTKSAAPQTSAETILAAPLSVKLAPARSTNSMLPSYAPSTPVTPPDHAR